MLRMASFVGKTMEWSNEAQWNRGELCFVIRSFGRNGRAKWLGEPRGRVAQHPRDAELHPGHGREDEARIGDPPEARLLESGDSRAPGSGRPGQRGPAHGPAATAATAAAAAAAAGGGRERRPGRHLQEALGGNRCPDYQGYGGSRRRGQEESWFVFTWERLLSGVSVL
jgi:hypothetical protein